MPNPTAAMLVIGDEILSGRTRDSNMHHLAGRLNDHGIDLIEVRVVSDRKAAITDAARELSERYDHLFTCGGIGPTHDDITAECIAAAKDTPIGIRDDARAILQAYYDTRDVNLNDARLRMARIPEGAVLIENPISAAPGFTLGNIHVMAGVPKIFEAMVVNLLPRLSGGAAMLSRTLRVDRGEGDIAGVLTEVSEAHPKISVGSYPFSQGDGFGVNIQVRGSEPDDLDAVIGKLREHFPEAQE